jgi:hypothetical protein
MKSFFDLFALLIAYFVGVYVGQHQHIAWYAWVVIVVLQVSAFRLINIYAKDKYDRYSR